MSDRDDAGVDFGALADLPTDFQKAGTRATPRPPRTRAKPQPAAKAAPPVRQYGKRADDTYTQFVAMIPKELKLQLKRYALDAETNLSEIAEEALEEYLETRR